MLDDLARLRELVEVGMPRGWVDEALAIIDRLGEDVPPADPDRPPDLAALRRLERGASVVTGGGFVEWAELAEGEYATRLIGELWALGKEDGDGS